MDYDFIVGFTLFTPKGFRTMYRHFDKLDTAKMFASNVNIKDNNKIYVDLKYFQDKIKAEIEEQKNMRVDGEVFTTSVNYAIKVLQSLLEKEIKDDNSKI